jgi:hypothetical protein
MRQITLGVALKSLGLNPVLFCFSVPDGLVARAQEFGITVLKREHRCDSPELSKEVLLTDCAIAVFDDKIKGSVKFTEDFVKIPKGIVTEIDTERLFTNAQRYILWQRQEGKCLRTGKVIPQEDINNHELWAADHVIPYSLGGETSINNGELVCQKYNLKKGAKLNYNPVAEESLV